MSDVEEAGAEALTTAVERWPADGVPPNPGACPTTTATPRPSTGSRSNPAQRWPPRAQSDRPSGQLTSGFGARYARSGVGADASLAVDVESRWA
jgi:predicted RNA polymerase sigma factor